MKGAMIVMVLSFVFAQAALAECSMNQARAWSFFDSNRTGAVEPIDVLQINRIWSYLNSYGAGPVKAGYENYDINKDGYVSPIDALLVINLYNGFPNNLGSCPISDLRAWAMMDEFNSSTLEPYLYKAHYHMLYYVTAAQSRRGKSLVGNYSKYDFDRNGRLDSADLKTITNAYRIR